MSLPLTWADKINSPLLADFIAKHGAEYCMTAEEINEMRDVINEIGTFFSFTIPSISALIPAFGTFKWVMRGTDHAGTVPIAGDIFAGMISATEFSSCMIWNGIGALDNTNLANFNIVTSIEI
jgi:hypothetical protein